MSLTMPVVHFNTHEVSADFYANFTSMKSCFSLIKAKTKLLKNKSKSNMHKTYIQILIKY